MAKLINVHLLTFRRWGIIKTSIAFYSIAQKKMELYLMRFSINLHVRDMPGIYLYKIYVYINCFSPSHLSRQFVSIKRTIKIDIKRLPFVQINMALC